MGIEENTIEKENPENAAKSLSVLTPFQHQPYESCLGWVHQHEASPVGQPRERIWAAGASGERRAEIRSFARKSQGAKGGGGGGRTYGTLEPPPPPPPRPRRPRRRRPRRRAADCEGAAGSRCRCGRRSKQASRGGRGRHLTSDS